MTSCHEEMTTEGYHGTSLGVYCLLYRKEFILTVSLKGGAVCHIDRARTFEGK